MVAYPWPVSRRFTRTTEDFVCLVCATAVRGDGYTNHCPSCLSSRHVDVNPGDRAARCGAVMRPVAVESRTHDLVITHVCERCGHRRRNRSVPADDHDTLLAVAAAAAQAATAPGLPAPGARPPRRPGRARRS
ncbi:hypothetical protein ThrDRAFT_01250 [Frankia casuarinae]|uniref:RNHCP domain-containing protein n=1 Tax=Frankia casuarinae (strain DSM 45818 / CECT 9043 / HFP020203 / CcI3) TaxID=106370 RepID=Q2J4Q5_FRACC|nr:hypothetical protein Francci3_4391 [Frankia casuarinae]ETA02678.1 hypothetical protein CcI6DRAFT_01855 [Frankia sp. CcI6]EYT93064.1 hypothetical protein ThrDRAFT_01250 [Frankia casuarinae]KFB07020.1 RNHCP domain [Frankia sp. Allo2]OAA30571.1 RNHCP domain-containing protein [Frankia casuarinae]